MRALVLGLILCGGLFAQAIVNTSGSAGGASAVNDLTDVTITSVANGDGWYYNGTAWINTNLFTAGTTDILAARMSANWGTAGTSACATTDGVMYDNGTAIVCDIDLQFSGAVLTIGATAAGMSSSYQLSFGTSGSRAGIYGETAGGVHHFDSPRTTAYRSFRSAAPKRPRSKTPPPQSA